MLLMMAGQLVRVAELMQSVELHLVRYCLTSAACHYQHHHHQLLLLLLQRLYCCPPVHGPASSHPLADGLALPCLLL
jgi:hypothetical protein